MEIFIHALATVFTPENLIAMLVGTLLGLLVGALPGLGPTVGIALLLPFTYALNPLTSLLMLTSLFQAGEYGGSISAILMNTPGTAAASATVLDGYPMNRQGFPGKAIAFSLFPSSIGGMVGVLALVTLSGVIVKIAISFGPAEFFALGIFGLTAVATLASGNVVKGMIAAVLGLLISTIGLDLITGSPRFTMGIWALYDGIPLVPVLIGLFACSEALVLVGEELKKRYDVPKAALKVRITLNELKQVAFPTSIGSVIGVLLGIFPGVGTTSAAWLSYNEAKRWSKNPEKFGTGTPEGIAAPESANNAVVASSLLPMLTLGIPGSPTAAVIMSALIVQGIQPGPDIVAKYPDMVYGLYVGMAVAVLMMMFIGMFATGYMARIVNIPNYILAPLIFLISSIGTYVKSGSLLDVGIMITFGLLGYILRKFHYPLPPFVLAFVLSFLVESNFRRALLISDGTFSIFFTRPISLMILICCALSLFYSLYREAQKKKPKEALKA